MSEPKAGRISRISIYYRDGTSAHKAFKENEFVTVQATATTSTTEKCVWE